MNTIGFETARPALRRGPGPADGIRAAGRILRRSIGLVSCWLRQARQRRALEALDERLRRDIGVTAEDVRRELAKPFWRA